MGNISAEQVVFAFFIICGVVILTALAIMGLVFVIASFKRMKSPEIDDEEYILYLKKGIFLDFAMDTASPQILS
ncbi:MAG: hypothetical protein HFF90_00545 [Oscillibacter sp.]|nr:hypothetical protein [Oscillibacter sp.]